MKVQKLWSYSSTRFVAVGITNTVIDFTILNILVFSFDLNKIIANSISVSIAMIISYFLNHSIVFKNNSQDHARKFILFIIITTFGLYVIQNIIIYFFVHIFNWPGDLATSIIHWAGFNSLTDSFIILNLAKLIATGVTMVWNYFMYKKFVFVDDKPITEQ